jgi:uncharacterized membrane protein (GlpM family)
MDWGYKAMLTTVTVALVLLVAQTMGRRLAGMLAGLPVITAPALLWIAAEQGAAFAARSAVGSIAACGLMAVFALTYERLSRRFGAAISLAGSLAVGGLAAMPMALLAGHPVRAIVLTGTICTLVVLLLPRASAQAGQARRMRGEIALTAVAAGGISVLVSLCARELGPYWSGLLAALPIISATALVTQHLTASHAEIERFLRGYVAGLIGKAAFALAFAAVVVQVGGALAVAAALAIGVAVTAATTRGLHRLEERTAGRLAQA